MTAYTPMIQQYLGIKEEYPDAFLFFRLGDFYEMFFEDAILASRELEITLTKRAGGGEEKIPMCGVPYHSSSQYIRRLIEKGYKVAICEQVEDPKEAKGVVRREVVQMITPGTLMEESMLPDRENNYILFWVKQDNLAMLACDLSTGEVAGTQTAELQAMVEEALQYQAAEMILSDDFTDAERQELKAYFPQCAMSVRTLQPTDQWGRMDDWIASESKNQATDTLRRGIHLMLSYLHETQKRSLDHLQRVQVYQASAFLHLDPFSRRNLELTETIRDNTKKGSLLWLLDETSTAMGGRLIKKWIQRPLMNKEQIEQRLAAVELFMQHSLEREELMALLDEVYDLERLAGRVSYGNVNPRDLVQLRRSLSVIPDVLALLEQLPTTYIQQRLLELDPCTDLVELLDHAIIDDPPLSIKDGGIFRMGYHPELDRLLEASRNGKQWIAELEAQERQKTGIKSLKVGFNKVFGYYIEVTKSNLHALKDERYERKQTLANAERYITPELKEKEALILEANDRLMVLEYELFLELRDQINQYLTRLQQLAHGVAQLDVVCSFARVSEKHHYVRPQFVEHQEMRIEAGRHPVVEKVLGESSFVANDVIMDADSREILLITGPNMAGKSTYMRQTALIVIMAQIGCFVPANQAVLPLFDQIFTRIGAADDLVGGQSTFMVEMMETKRAITKATRHSLLLLDEIGRGTSTYDGMSLAQAVIEYIHEHVQAKTLFSTHYHELTVLEEELAKVTNVHVACSEKEGRVIFLHKVREGRADRSYGIHVAELAEMPAPVIERARVLLESLEGHAPALCSDRINIRVSQGPAGEENGVAEAAAAEEENSPENSLRNEGIQYANKVRHTAPVKGQGIMEGIEHHNAAEQLTGQERQVIEQIQFHFGDEEEQKVLEHLKGLNLVQMTPLDALNTLYKLQESLKKNV